MTNQSKKTFARALKLSLMGLFLSLASGCGIAPKHDPVLSVDPAFTPYVARFEQASADHGRALQVKDLIMNFGDVSSMDSADTTTRGLCAYAEGETPIVTINEEAWLSSSDDDREELVFHELGHCVLGLRHVEGINEDGIPASIMDPVEINSAIYRQYRSYYMQTLFAHQ